MVTNGGVVRASLALPPAPESARAARGFCAQHLAGTPADVVDTVTLLVSELVSNAVLHARTAIEVAVDRDGDDVRVAVSDASPVPPTLREYGTTAVTGRGLALVASLATDHGVDTRPAGKTVWFRVTPGAPEGSWGDWSAVIDELAGPGVDDVRVTLQGLPLAPYLVLQEQNDALLREFALVHARAAGVAEPSPPLLADLTAAERAQGRLAAAVAGLPATREEYVDVVVDVPRQQVHDFEHLRRVLGEAVVLAARGELLVRPTLPELRALRAWCFEQLLSSATGAPTGRWPGSEEFPDDELALPLAPFDAELDPRAAVVVADDGNRIVAVTPPAAELLGWSEDELVGRRLVTLIPPRLRDAHVAGFTRLLLTGQPRLLGAPVRLPAQHRDGREIDVDVLITATPVGEGRVVFTAELRRL